MNSPGLWPLACQITIMMSFLHFVFFLLFVFCPLGSFVIFCPLSSFLWVRSSFSALSHWSLRHFPLSQPSVNSFNSPGATGPTGSPATRPPPNGGYPRVRLRLKIALVFDPVFDRFWTVFDPQDGSKIDPKSLPKSIVLCIVF